MMREAGHLDAVKRMRIHEKDLLSLVPHYEVAWLRLVCLMQMIDFSLAPQGALERLKQVYVRS